MAKECLKMYFMKPPPGNQFLCRAYLCQAQLLAPTATNPVSNEEDGVWIDRGEILTLYTVQSLYNAMFGIHRKKGSSYR